MPARLPSHRPSPAARLLPAAAAVTAAMLTGCASTAAAVPLGIVRDARARTMAAGSARIRAQAVLTGITSRNRVARMTETGAENFRRDVTEETAVVSGTGTFQVRIIGRSWYQRAAGQRLWHLRREGPLVPAGTGPAGTAPLVPGDPAEVLTILSYRALSVTRVGTERIGGQLTTHYHAVLRLGDTTGYPADVWIDGRHRILRARVVVIQSLPAQPASPGPGGATATPARVGPRHGSLTLTVVFSSFGVPVTVTAPPAAQVTTH
jgi:hypothetical protein